MAAEDFPADIPDERFTPPAVVRELHRIYGFTVDAFSHPLAPSAAIIGRHWTAADDAYCQRWDGERLFVQPPYSDIGRAVAFMRNRARFAGAFSVALVPAWTDREWWADLVEPQRDLAYACAGFQIQTRFLPGRMRFGNPHRPDPENDGGPKVDQAKFGMVLIVVRPA